MFDTADNIGTYTSLGVGGAVGGNASFGASFGVLGSTTSGYSARIGDFGGPFVNASFGAGLGPAATLDGFFDPYSSNFGIG